MAQSTPLSIRLDESTHEGLREAAQARGATVSGLAAELVASGLDGAEPGEHPLVAYTRELCAQPADTGRERAEHEALLALALVVADGGSPAVRATGEWLRLVWRVTAR